MYENVYQINPGSKACIHDGDLKEHLSVWKESGSCRECTCINTVTQCTEILCPNNMDCDHTYRPEGYCCPVCCPNQYGSETADSGE